MKLKLLILVLVLAPAFLFAQSNSVQNLIAKKNNYDSLRNSSLLKIEVLIQMQGDTSLYIIHDAEFPSKGIATTFNILRNKDGKIVMVSAYPYSESGDWFVAITHYFNPDGKTFAFERLISFYNSGCTDGMATEKIADYYDNNFAVVNNTYSLTDKKNESLKKSKCNFPYNFNYTASKSIEEVCKQYHIPITFINAW